MTTFTYFAYGSNMLPRRLQKRCPSATFLRSAYAEGYSLKFNKKSVDGSGKATLAKSDEDEERVYGALFEIEVKDRHSLDDAEGHEYYRNDEFDVKHSGTNEQEAITTYIAKPEAIEENLVPYHWYKHLVLAGAWQAKLPNKHIERIKSIDAISDPKQERDRRKEAIKIMNECSIQDDVATDDKVKIAGNFTVGDWKELKPKLVPNGEEGNWPGAYKMFFLTRLETRYFLPIRLLQEHGDDKGEGFSIVALQCTLIEFFASIYKGGNYKHGARSYEIRYCNRYKQSEGMFIEFLKSAPVFKQYFTSTKIATDFYENVRCPLLHEARTKGNWRILAGCRCDPPIDTRNKIIYRNKFQSIFLNFVEEYREELLRCSERQEAFIRKFDYLCTE